MKRRNHYIQALVLLVALVFALQAGNVMAASFIDLGVWSNPAAGRSADEHSLPRDPLNKTSYKNSARTLVFIPASFDTKVVMREDGVLTIKTPWYGFLLRSEDMREEKKKMSLEIFSQ
jgi:hypothetical protein